MTTTDAKHTPTPLAVLVQAHNHVGRSPDGRNWVATIVRQNTCVAECFGYTEQEAYEQAALIVKAVNSYELMKEALIYYMSQFGQCLGAYGIELTSDQIKADNQARAALKIAGE
jgi:hypothetical protein